MDFIRRWLLVLLVVVSQIFAADCSNCPKTITAVSVCGNTVQRGEQVYLSGVGSSDTVEDCNCYLSLENALDRTVTIRLDSLYSLDCAFTAIFNTESGPKPFGCNDSNFTFKLHSTPVKVKLVNKTLDVTSLTFCLHMSATSEGVVLNLRCGPAPQSTPVSSTAAESSTATESSVSINTQGVVTDMTVSSSLAGSTSSQVSGVSINQPTTSSSQQNTSDGDGDDTPPELPMNSKQTSNSNDLSTLIIIVCGCVIGLIFIAMVVITTSLVYRRAKRAKASRLVEEAQQPEARSMNTTKDNDSWTFLDNDLYISYDKFKPKNGSVY